MVLDGLKVDRDAAVDYVKSNLPTYIEFENWVVDQRGGSIPQDEIDASNAAINGYHHDDETARCDPVRRRCGRRRVDSGRGKPEQSGRLDGIPQ